MTGRQKNISCVCKRAIFSLFLSFISLFVIGQKNEKRPKGDHDSSYYASYREKLVLRLYLSRKYTTAKLVSPNEAIPVMKYRPNSTLNIGIGATYRSLTINIGIGITSFNPNNERGETKYLDLQGHFYTRTWNFDFMGQFYRGYYLSPQGLAAPEGQNYYIRPDLKVQIGGLSAFRALNDRKFSYQAGLVNNEWQKKSAGSLLVGGEGYYGSLHGDSTLVPSVVDSSYAVRDIKKLHFFEIGPGIGYAYVFVYKEHYYALASGSMTLDFRFAREIEGSHYADKVDLTPNFMFHAGVGYNSEKWNLTLLWIGSQIYVRGPATNYKYGFGVGNYRLIYARRFPLNRKVKKMLTPVNDLIEAK